MKTRQKKKRYYCKKSHLYGENGMYHYDDEVIYEKHLEADSEVEELD